MDARKLIITALKEKVASDGIDVNTIDTLNIIYEGKKTKAVVKLTTGEKLENELSFTENSMIKIMFINKINKITKKELNKTFDKLILSIDFNREILTLLGVENKEVIDLTEKLKNIL